MPSVYGSGPGAVKGNVTRFRVRRRAKKQIEGRTPSICARDLFRPHPRPPLPRCGRGEILKRGWLPGATATQQAEPAETGSAEHRERAGFWRGRCRSEVVGDPERGVRRHLRCPVIRSAKIPKRLKALLLELSVSAKFRLAILPAPSKSAKWLAAIDCVTVTSLGVAVAVLFKNRVKRNRHRNRLLRNRISQRTQVRLRDGEIAVEIDRDRAAQTDVEQPGQVIHQQLVAGERKRDAIQFGKRAIELLKQKRLGVRASRGAVIVREDTGQTGRITEGCGLANRSETHRGPSLRRGQATSCRKRRIQLS